MTSMLRGRAAFALLALAATATPGRALADDAPRPTKERCFDAYEQAQRLRKAYHLLQAREHLVTCGSSTCPPFVAQDCTKWLGEVEASTPTIVVLARGPDGAAIEDVRVSLDGRPFAERLDGRALPVDPGPHDLHVEAAAGPIDEHVVVAEGAKNQQIVVQVGRAPERPPAPPTQVRRRIPLETWVLGGVAVAGAVSFAAFAIAGRSIQSCAPDCTRSQVDDLRRDYVVADVSWITGLVAAGAALYFAIAAPSSAPPAPVTAIRW
jgi:hypothetical protein